MMEEKESRPRGRPRSIDRTMVLDRAADAFWRLGYDGASLSDLTEAMGVSRPTLYAAYGDKAELFLSALNRYGERYGAAPLEAFLTEPEIAAATAAFLRTSAIGNTEPGMPSGCLIACCAPTVAETNQAVRDRLAEISDQTAAALAERFAAEAATGRLADDPPPSARARRLIDMMYAQAIRARAGETRDALLAELPDRVRAVIGEVD